MALRNYLCPVLLLPILALLSLARPGAAEAAVPVVQTTPTAITRGSFTGTIPTGTIPFEPASEPAGILCPLLPEFTAGTKILGHVQAVLKPGGELHILAVGSGTVLGPNANTPSAAFPYRMAEALKQALPNATIELTVHGGRGLTAEEMLPLIKAELAKKAFQLVLWQTGTVEAVRGLRAEAFHQALNEGVALASARGADLILVDPQYSRFLRTNANLGPYEDALTQVAALPDVTLFRRFDLMHGWVEANGIDLERAQARDRARLAEALHACLGQALAHLVLDGAQPAPAAKPSP
jgi:acyl-CoA thioesterase-1